MKDGMVPAWTLGEITAAPAQPTEAFDHYRDTGCEIAPRCLSCPLPLCRHDLPPKRAGSLMREMQLQVLLDNGHTNNEAAEAMGVSQRTIFRLKELRATTAQAMVG